MADDEDGEEAEPVVYTLVPGVLSLVSGAVAGEAVGVERRRFVLERSGSQTGER